MIYRLKKDFMYTTSDDKVMTLKEGTPILRKEGEEYIVTQGRQKEYRIKAALVEKNPDIFEKIDLKTQIINLLKKSKAKTAPKIASEVTTFLEEEHFKGKELVEEEYLALALEACRLQFIASEEKKWLEPILKLGWDVDANGVYKNK